MQSSQVPGTKTLTLKRAKTRLNKTKTLIPSSTLLKLASATLSAGLLIKEEETEKIKADSLSNSSHLLTVVGTPCTQQQRMAAPVAWLSSRPPCGKNILPCVLVVSWNSAEITALIPKLI